MMPDFNAHGLDPSWVEPEEIQVQEFFNTLHEGYITAEPRLVQDTTQAELDYIAADTSILHHAFISIFIALWAVITHYISILMAILSYFTRFTMKRGNADSWNSGWKRSKRWKPILHSSKIPETPRNNLLELIRIYERKK